MTDGPKRAGEKLVDDRSKRRWPRTKSAISDNIRKFTRLVRVLLLGSEARRGMEPNRFQTPVAKERDMTTERNDR